MVEIYQRTGRIVMTRGDTLLTHLSIKDSKGDPYEPAPTDTIRFAVKDKLNNEETLIVKDIPVDTMTLRLDSEDTKQLKQPHDYHYDIQITYGDNMDIVCTIIAGTLQIVEEAE